MNLKHFFSVLALAAQLSSSYAYGADIDVDKIREDQCTRYYKQIDDFLQYLYRVDGNLKELNPSKVKRIDHLESVFEDYKATTPQRRAAFNELFNDPDWWVFKLQRNSKKLIGQLEALKKDLNWDTFKKLATQQADRQIAANFFNPSATGSMEKTVEVINAAADYFSERTEIKDRLDALGASSRLSRAFSNDAQQDAFESKMHFYLPSRLMKCQIDFLANRLNKKQ
jgi:hypothetical protein